MATYKYDLVGGKIRVQKDSEARNFFPFHELVRILNTSNYVGVVFVNSQYSFNINATTDTVILSGTTIAAGSQTNAQLADTLSASPVFQGVSSGGSTNAANSFKEMTINGTSIIKQHTKGSGADAIIGSQGYFNHANSLIGAPFHITQNLGVSGDLCENICSRVDSIHSHIDVVGIDFPTNDIITFPPDSSVAATTAEFNRLKGLITVALTQLKSEGKIVITTTPPPNDSITSLNARASLLDQMVAWFLTLKDQGLVDGVADLFTVCWDAAKTTQRVFKAGYTSDGTHLTNLSGYECGKLIAPMLKSAYAKSKSQSHRTFGTQDQMARLGKMRTGIPGANSSVAAGVTGQMASGWAGTGTDGSSSTSVTAVASLVPFVPGSEYVGPNAQSRSGNEGFQKFVISNAVDGSIIRQQIADGLVRSDDTEGFDFGDSFYLSVDVLVQNPINLKAIRLSGVCFFQSGSGDIDQAFGSAPNQARTGAGVSSNNQQDFPFKEGFREVIFTEPIRIPENVNGNAPATVVIFIDALFSGVGSAIINYARVRLLRKLY